LSLAIWLLKAVECIHPLKMFQHLWKKGTKTVMCCASVLGPCILVFLQLEKCLIEVDLCGEHSVEIGVQI